MSNQSNRNLYSITEILGNSPSFQQYLAKPSIKGVFSKILPIHTDPDFEPFLFNLAALYCCRLVWRVTVPYEEPLSTVNYIEIWGSKGDVDKLFVKLRRVIPMLSRNTKHQLHRARRFNMYRRRKRRKGIISPLKRFKNSTKIARMYKHNTIILLCNASKEILENSLKTHKEHYNNLLNIENHFSYLDIRYSTTRLKHLRKFSYIIRHKR